MYGAQVCTESGDSSLGIFETPLQKECEREGALASRGLGIRRVWVAKGRGSTARYFSKRTDLKICGSGRREEAAGGRARRGLASVSGRNGRLGLPSGFTSRSSALLSPAPRSNNSYSAPLAKQPAKRAKAHLVSPAILDASSGLLPPLFAREKESKCSSALPCLSTHGGRLLIADGKDAEREEKLYDFPEAASRPWKSIPREVGASVLTNRNSEHTCGSFAELRGSIIYNPFPRLFSGYLGGNDSRICARSETLGDR
ncbi:hypothetical protein KM043_003950 [Ampulex compressa]|nr:hypothetical protein KM043_003950 [Ampulex compressa]